MGRRQASLVDGVWKTLDGQAFRGFDEDDRQRLKDLLSRVWINLDEVATRPSRKHSFKLVGIELVWIQFMESHVLSLNPTYLRHINFVWRRGLGEIAMIYGWSGRHEDARVALVVGNGAYHHSAALKNPKNDATALADTFEKIGFDQVVLGIDLERDELEELLRSFRKLADKADMAIIYFAGHGIELGGKNYVLPIDVNIIDPRDANQAVSLGELTDCVSKARKLKLVILDACRDNPIKNRMKRSKQVRSLRRGLARVEPRGDALVAYATKHGQIAYDGDHVFSPYAQSLLKCMEEPGIELGMFFRIVRDEVLEITKGRQEPYTYGSLGRESIYLNKPLEEYKPTNKPKRPGWKSYLAKPLTASLWIFIGIWVGLVGVSVFGKYYIDFASIPESKIAHDEVIAPEIDDHETSIDGKNHQTISSDDLNARRVMTQQAHPDDKTTEEVAAPSNPLMRLTKQPPEADVLNGIAGADLPVDIPVPADAGTAEVRIDGLPPSARLNVGREVARGSWNVAASDLGGLTVKTPPEAFGAFELKASFDRGAGEPQVLKHLWLVLASPSTKNEDRVPQPGMPGTPDSAAPDVEAGTLIASASPSPSADATATLGHRSVLYEEGNPGEGGFAYNGKVTWSTKKDRTTSSALLIHGFVDIPQRNLKLFLTLRRNTDANLPASHIIELLFEVPSTFTAVGIANVPGVLLKLDEPTKGTALAGVAKRATDNHFLVGLSSTTTDQARNMDLLRTRGWVDVPILYSNKKRAILTIEKGSEGERIFGEAFASWAGEESQ